MGEKGGGLKMFSLIQIISLSGSLAAKEERARGQESQGEFPPCNSPVHIVGVRDGGARRILTPARDFTDSRVIGDERANERGQETAMGPNVATRLHCWT